MHSIEFVGLFFLTIFLRIFVDLKKSVKIFCVVSFSNFLDFLLFLLAFGLEIRGDYFAQVYVYTMSIYYIYIYLYYTREQLANPWQLVWIF